MPNNNIAHVSVAAVITGFNPTNGFHVLLKKREQKPFKNGFSLPETDINTGENAEDAIERIIEDSVELKTSYLSQMHAFTEPTRDPRGPSVCIAYLAIINQETFESSFKNHEWQPLNELTPLAFDHNQIVQQAAQQIQNKLRHLPIAFNLLSSEFTFSDLEKVYMHGTEKEIDRRNFKKKILNYQLLIPLNKKLKSIGRGRPAELFRLNKAVYRQLMKSGFHIEI